MINLFEKYSLLALISLFFDYIFTKLNYPKARIIRRPFYIRGKKYIKINAGFITGVGTRIDAFPIDKGVCVQIGKNVQFNDYVHVASVRSVVIGDNVLIASKVFITDHNHGSYGAKNPSSPMVPPIERELSSAPVRIEDNVWIGEFVSVLPGVTIGIGSIIGTMSVVTKDIPPYSIAIGSPARVVKQYNFDRKIWEKV